MSKDLTGWRTIWRCVDCGRDSSDVFGKYKSLGALQNEGWRIHGFAGYEGRTLCPGCVRAAIGSEKAT